jgi:hypothetical protein
MRIRIQLVLLIRKPQTPVRIEHLFTQRSEELLEHPAAVDAGPTSSQYLIHTTTTKTTKTTGRRKRRHILLLPELIHERDLNRRPQIRPVQLIEPILRDAPPPDRHPRPPAPSMSVHAAADHIVSDEMAEYGHARLEGDGEGDVVEDAEAGGHVGDLALREGAGACWLFDLLFFEAVVLCFS